MRTFKNVTPKHDCVTTYASNDGFYRIVKRPSVSKWIVKEYSLFNMLGTIVGEFDTLEDAIAAFA